VFYLPQCKEKSIKALNANKYRKAFCTDFSIGFILPQSDILKICDKVTAATDNACK
jgi:hypothetical protein